MKKFISYVLAVVMLFSAFSVAAFSAEGGTDVVNKSRNTTVVIPKAYSDTQEYAANILKKYIKEITGIDVPVKSAPDLKGINIYIGEDAASPVSAKGLDDGAYIIKEHNDDLYIIGSGRRGDIYGVYGFLEKYCDCRWYTTDLKVIPESEKIIVPDNLEYTYEPYFEYTETDWLSPRDPEYSLANGLNGGVYRNLTKEQGGTVDYISGFCHTLTSQFCSADKYFEEHPEYFALRDGKRTRNQLCLTNPDVLKIVTDEVLALCKAKHDPSQPVQIISLTQADNVDYCTCDKCRALDEKNGSCAGTMITFANAVAKKVKEAGYDNIAIDTFAYQYTRKTPVNVVPNDNVIVRLCSIECCFGHTLDDPSCAQNAEFMNDLKNWGKICDRVYVWDYTTNYRETINIFPDFHVLQPNMQVFYENSVKGVYEEGNYYMKDCNSEFGELRAYLLSKLMQDPYMDFDKEMNGFLKAYYGNGWEKIREFIDYTCAYAEKDSDHIDIFKRAEDYFPKFTRKDIKYCDALWRDAKALAENDIYLERMERAEFSWRYWKCSAMRGEFSRLLPCWKWMNAQETLYKDLMAFGIVKRGEHDYFSDCATLYLLLIPYKWREKDAGKFMRAIEPLVVNFYNVVNIFNKLEEAC